MILIKYLFLIIFPIVAGMIMSGGVGQFIDPPSVFIVIVPTVGTLLVAYKGSFISSVTSIWQYTGNEKLSTAIAFWKTVRTCAVGYGCLGFFIGLVSMLSSLDDMELLGPRMAIALLAVAHGIVARYLVAEPIIALLENKKRQSRI